MCRIASWPLGRQFRACRVCCTCPRSPFSLHGSLISIRRPCSFCPLPPLLPGRAGPGHPLRCQSHCGHRDCLLLLAVASTVTVTSVLTGLLVWSVVCCLLSVVCCLCVCCLSRHSRFGTCGQPSSICEVLATRWVPSWDTLVVPTLCSCTQRRTKTSTSSLQSAGASICRRYSLGKLAAFTTV